TLSRTPPVLWTREASWSAPRRRGAFDPTSHTHNPKDPPHPTAATGPALTEGLAPCHGRPPSCGRAKRPGVHRDAAELSIPPATPTTQKLRRTPQPRQPSTSLFRSHLVTDAPRLVDARSVLECAATPRRFR